MTIFRDGLVGGREGGRITVVAGKMAELQCRQEHLQGNRGGGRDVGRVSVVVVGMLARFQWWQRHCCQGNSGGGWDVSRVSVVAGTMAEFKS